MKTEVKNIPFKDGELLGVRKTMIVLKHNIERPLVNIRISKTFLTSSPSEETLNKYRKCFTEKGYIGTVLRINKAGYLVDNYEGYLVLKENNVEKAIIMVI